MPQQDPYETQNAISLLR